MGTDISDLFSTGLEIGKLILVGAAAAWGMAFKKGKDQAMFEARFASVQAKVEVLESLTTRLSDVEANVRGMPTWGDINSLKTEVNFATQSLASLTAKLDMTVKALDQVNKHIWEGLRNRD